MAGSGFGNDQKQRDLKKTLRGNQEGLITNYTRSKQPYEHMTVIVDVKIFEDYEIENDLEKEDARKSYYCGIDQLGGRQGVQFINNRCQDDISDRFPNGKQAYESLCAAATKGYAPAINDTGICHHTGLGTFVNKEMALTCFMKVALEAKREPIGYYNTGLAYLTGTSGVPKNLDVAFNCFQGSLRIAEKHRLSQAEPLFGLGLYYEEKSDFARAIEKYLASAAWGFVEAKYRYAMIGFNLDKNNLNRVWVFLEQAAPDYAPAAYELGRRTYNNSLVIRAALEKYPPALQAAHELKLNLSGQQLTLFPALRQATRGARPSLLAPDASAASAVAYDTKSGAAALDGKDSAGTTKTELVSTTPFPSHTPAKFPPDLKNFLQRFEFKFNEDHEKNKALHLGFLQRSVIPKGKKIGFHEKTGTHCQLTKSGSRAKAFLLLSDLRAFGLVDVSSSDIEILNVIYSKEKGSHNLQLADIQTLNQIFGYFDFSQSKWKPGRARIRAKPLLRLIGNDLADSGTNDLFIIKLIAFLSANQAPLEVLFSRGSWNFIAHFSGGLLPKYKQSPSDSSLKKLLLLTTGSNPLVTSREIHQFLEKHYYPHLKLVSYSLSETQDQLTIFTHAPCGLRGILRLANELEIFDKKITKQYLRETKENLMDVIDRINARLAKLMATVAGRLQLFSLASVEQMVWRTTLDPDFETGEEDSDDEDDFEDEYTSIVSALEDETDILFMCDKNNDHDNEYDLELSHHVTLSENEGVPNFIEIAYVAPQSGVASDISISASVSAADLKASVPPASATPTTAAASAVDLKASGPSAPAAPKAAAASGASSAVPWPFTFSTTSSAGSSVVTDVKAETPASAAPPVTARPVNPPSGGAPSVTDVTSNRSPVSAAVEAAAAPRPPAGSAAALATALNQSGMFGAGSRVPPVEALASYREKQKNKKKGKGRGRGRP